MKLVNVKMFNKIHNLGDSINPFIIGAVSGAVPVYSEVTEKHVLGIGSISFYANENSYVWGSGEINGSRLLGNVNPKNVRALRGERSLNFYRSSLGRNNLDVPLGDPGYLIKRFVDFGEVDKKYKACFVPHHGSLDNQVYKMAGKNNELCVFNIVTCDLSELVKIKQSEVVISQSLHGLIFAEALGVPSVWVSSRFDEAWKFKFHDWYSTTFEPFWEPLSLNQPIDQLIANARLSGSKIDIDELLSAFPTEAIFDSERDVTYLSDFNVKPVTRVLTDELENLDFNDFLNKARLMHRRASEHLAIPNYSIVGKDAGRVSENNLQSMVEIMNIKHKFSYSYVKVGVEPPSGYAYYEVNGFKVTKNFDVGDSVIVRPNGVLESGGEFLTIYC